MFQFKREPICHKIQGMLSDYVDDILDAEKKNLVESHLALCEACSKELKSLRMTVQLLHRVPNVATPRSFTILVPETEKEATPVSSRDRRLQPVPVMVSRSGMEAILAPSSLRWLRPATAVASIVLMVLLVGDFMNFFGHENQTSNDTLLTGARFEAVTLAPSSVGEGNDTLDAYSDGNLTVKASGFTPSPEAAGNESANAFMAGAQSDLGPPSLPGAETLPGQGTTNWPLLQIEMAMGVIVFILAVPTLIMMRQRRKLAASKVHPK